VRGLILCGSGKGPVEASCDNDNKISDSKKCREFFE
jgi:hypothetical protein